MKKEELLNKLRTIGLSKHGAEIYLTLLEYVAQQVSGIAQRTDIHRPTIYETLEELKGKKFIEESTRGKRTTFIALAPTQFVTRIQDTRNALETLVQDLTTYGDKRIGKPRVAFFTGPSGIQEVFNDMLDVLPTGSTWYRFSSRTDLIDDHFYLPADYKKRRDQKKLERMVITNQEIRQTKKVKHDREVKVLNDSNFHFDITKLIYADRVIHIDYRQEHATMFINQRMAEF